MSDKKTGFDRWVDEKMKDSSFAKAYEEAKIEIAEKCAEATENKPRKIEAFCFWAVGAIGINIYSADYDVCGRCGK